MPELPEVRVVVSKLKKYVIGKKIKEILVSLPKLIKNVSIEKFKEALEQSKIINVTNIGKFIIFHLNNNHILVSHLRMEGKYRIDGDQKHDYIGFLFTDGSKLIYNDTRQFGTFHLFLKNEYLNKLPLSKLANEPQNTKKEWLFNKLQRKIIAIKSALLDQNLLVGLGNIYVNEVLWATKINPLRAANSISLKQIQEILNWSEKIMNESTKMGGTTIHSFKSFQKETGNYQDKLMVHGKKNKSCQRCGEAIKKIKVNGRGTYYCPKCQKN